MKNSKQISVKIFIFIVFIIFICISFFIEFNPGIEIGKKFSSFSIEMIKILPPIFILIGLFDVGLKEKPS